MTQDDLAGTSSIARTVASKLENDKIAYTQEALATALSCEAWEVIEQTPEMEGADILTVWNRIGDPEDRPTTLHVLEALVELNEFREGVGKQ
ncbi:hypothetical protein [Maricaulis sp.]|uniref:hypothetical protein n=1 Tax=Maricaulis sp. TaxID=1486257 RepID=UPI003A9071BB